ncbi:unnamed protein product [Allacma fusca]|uniref:Thyrotropin-releasing hormone receptor n=1 Tax=Allacma fusca TaxID=39272 RepID=A0A8J2JZB7_9HEXA|nr:unnamed protein product [Allacma fusca]
MEATCNETALKALIDQEMGNVTIPNDLNSPNYIFSPTVNASVLTDIFTAANCSKEDFLENMTGGITPEYYSHTYRAVGTLFQGFVLLVGVLGNSMVVYVVARTKSMHSPTNCYLVSLALADCIVLIAAVPQEILQYYLLGNQWIWGEYGCAAFIFFQHLGINASSLSLTAFTVERYIAICHPMKAQSMCTVSRARAITIGVWIFAVLYCFPWLVFLTRVVPLNYDGHPNLEQCSFKLSRQQYLAFYFADLFVFYIVPLLLSTILYSLIARILFHSQRAKASGKLNGQTVPFTVDSTKTNAARVQVVKMLVMVVVIFAVLWLPYRGMLVYNSIAAMFSGEPLMDLWFLMLAKTCVYINSAINPILYNAMSVKFRRAFGRALTCGKSREFYDRWPYCRTNTTYTTANSTSHLVSSNSTMTYQLRTLSTKGQNNSASVARNNSPNTHNHYANVQHLSPPVAHKNRKNSTHSHSPQSSLTDSFKAVEIIVDSSETIHSCHDDDITEL